jgi:hypothetical protein
MFEGWGDVAISPWDSAKKAVTHLVRSPSLLVPFLTLIVLVFLLSLVEMRPLFEALILISLLVFTITWFEVYSRTHGLWDFKPVLKQIPRVLLVGVLFLGLSAFLIWLYGFLSANVLPILQIFGNASLGARPFEIYLARFIAFISIVLLIWLFFSLFTLSATWFVFSFDAKLTLKQFLKKGLGALRWSAWWRSVVLMCVFMIPAYIFVVFISLQQGFFDPKLLLEQSIISYFFDLLLKSLPSLTAFALYILSLHYMIGGKR